jgi:formylglycine-generating enzyme
MFSALSDDEGRTWRHHKLLTPGPAAREYDGGGNTGRFMASAVFAEPGGYLNATQAPDGTIHLLSSRLHYELDLQYLMSPTVSREA